MSNDPTPVEETAEETPWKKRVLERKRERAAAAAAEAAVTERFEDLVPERDADRSEESYELDAAISRIDIIDAYSKWCGKMQPLVRPGQRESIKISCPTPGHRDDDPSAWINLDKQTWFCGGCEQGGDIFDIAAFSKGYTDKSYKDGTNFPELKRAMALDFGFTISESAGVTVVSRPAPEAEAVPEDSVAEPIAPVVNLVDDDDEDDIIFPTIKNWRLIVPEGTFLWKYMEATCVDDSAEEYHLWHGMLALGFALGRDVRLWDTRPVYGNLFLCTLGNTGVGKSNSQEYLNQVLRAVLPLDTSDPFTKGVDKISSPGSPEAIIGLFEREVMDPSSPKTRIGYAPVRGLIEYGEFSGLINRSNRQGSPMKATLIDFYDMKDFVESPISAGRRHAERPFAGALTTAQPIPLKNLLTEEDLHSGFLNRWLFITGGEKLRFALGGVRPDLTQAIEELKSIFGWAGSFRGDEEVQWSDEAKVAWREFFYSTVLPDQKGVQILARMDLTMKKLILLFAANLKLKVVSKEVVDQATALYGYLKAAYGIPAGMIGNTRSREVSDVIEGAIKRFIKKHKKPISMSYLKKMVARKKFDDWEILKALETLEKMGTITREVGKSTEKGGRPGVRFNYNAALS